MKFISTNPNYLQILYDFSLRKTNIDSDAFVREWPTYRANLIDIGKGMVIPRTTRAYSEDTQAFWVLLKILGLKVSALDSLLVLNNVSYLLEAIVFALKLDLNFLTNML